MPFYNTQDAVRFFLNPLFPAFLLLLWLLLKKERRRGGVLALLCYLYLVTIPCTAQVVMRRWEVEDTVDRSKRYDAAVVLGGVVDYKWYLRHSTPGEREIFQGLANYQQFGQSAARVLMGASVIKSGLADKLLLSQVSIRKVNETRIVQDFYRNQGIGDDKIAVHGRVRNTLAEAKSIKAYCEQNNLKDILLITSASHMRRAAALFRKQGLEPALLSVSRQNTPITRESFVPSADGLEATYSMLLELVGYSGYALRGDIDPAD
ncbi:MAG: YdcF family protein [Thermodesulfobacteriota bacterium]